MLPHWRSPRLSDDPTVPDDVAGVHVEHWNPVRTLPDVRDGGPDRDQPVGNFGDLFGPAIVRALHARLRLGRAIAPARLLAVGSILHFAKEGDVVWGVGRNGKVSEAEHPQVALDVRAVRGPLTAAWLRERGHTVPQVTGDPAMLLPALFPQTRRWRTRTEHPLTVLPNLNDWHSVADEPHAWHPRRGLAETVQRIAKSELVVASSLHGIIVAEALGVPVRPCSSAAEHPWKYEDWFEGTGRRLPRLAESVDEAVSLGPIDPVRLDAGPLTAAFPSELWR